MGERAQLASALRVPGPGLVLVTGPPGIGKTALVEATTSDMGTCVATGQGLPGLAWRPYLALSMVCGTELIGEPRSVAERVASTIRDDLLVVDDLHWCDPDSIEAIEELAGLARLCCIARSGTDAAVRLASLTQPQRRIELGPLDIADAATLIAEARPGLPALERDRILSMADGNPLLLKLASLGHPDRTEVGDVLRAEVARLTVPQQVALSRVALAAGVDAAVESEPTLDQLVALGLVLRRGEGFILRHDLLEDAVVAVLEEDVLRSLRLELAERTSVPGVRARCLAAAGDTEAAHEAALEAARSAVSRHERANHLLLAVHLFDPDDRPNALVTEAAEAALAASRYEEVIELLGHHPVKDLDASSLAVLAQASWSVGRHELTGPACEHGIVAARGTDPLAEAKLLALHARVKGRIEWDGPEALRLARAAVETCEAHGLLLPEVHGALATASLVAGTDEWRGALDRAIEQSAATEDAWAMFTAFDTLFFAELIQGDPSRCQQLGRRGLEITSEMGSSLLISHMRSNLAIGDFHVGGRLEPVIDELESLSQRPLHPRTRDHVDAHLAIALADVGNVSDALEVVDSSASWGSTDTTTQAMIRWAAAEVLWQAGRWEEAVDEATACRDVLTLGFPAGDLVEPVRQWARIDLGQGPGAPLPQVGFANLEGARLESSAIVELVGGADSDELVTRFIEAAEAWSTVSVRGALRCRWAAGFAAAVGGDGATARQLLEPLADELERAGRMPLLHRVRASLRRVGARPTPLGNPVDPFTGAEAEILRLVAEGAGSALIARRIHLSRSTVDSTIRNAMAKTGTTNRLAAALLLHDLERSEESTTVDQHLVIAATKVDAERFAGALAAERLEPDSLDRTRFDLHNPQRVLVTSIDDDASADAALLAAGRGAHVVCAAPKDDRLRAILLDGLRRIGPVTLVDPAEPIDDDLVSVIELLDAGLTITDTATELGYSVRSLYRLLAQARALHGVTTNAELVVQLRGRDISDR